MTDLAIHKTIEKTKTIEGVSTSISGTGYTAGQVVTLTLPGARAERIWKVEGTKPIHRGISKSNWDQKDATTTVYDYKKRLWTWRIIGKYATTGFTGSHNFYTDARLLIDDGGPITVTFQDKTIKVFSQDGQFTWEGGMLHVVDYTLDFMEGFERT